MAALLCACLHCEPGYLVTMNLTWRKVLLGQFLINVWTKKVACFLAHKQTSEAPERRLPVMEVAIRVTNVLTSVLYA